MVYGVTGRDGDITQAWIRNWAPDGPVGDWRQDSEVSAIGLFVQAALRLYAAEARLQMSIGTAAKLGKIKFGAADEAA